MKYFISFGILSSLFFSCSQFNEKLGLESSSKLAPVTVAAPSSFTVLSVNDSSINFSWSNHESSALLNQVEMCTGEDCTNFTEVSRSPYGPQVTQHTESGLSSSTTYRFRVKTISRAGDSQYLVSTNIKTLLQPNTSLSFYNATASSVSISWVVNDINATGIQIQRCNGSSCTNFSDTFSSPLAAGTTSYTEGGLSESSVYRLRLRAITANSQSDWLTTSDLSTLPFAPTALLTHVDSSSAISLSWQDNSSAETSFDLQKCIGSGCTQFTAVTGSPFVASTVSHTESALTAGTTYRFRVRAVSNTASSEWLTSSDITTSSVPVPAVLCSQPSTQIIDQGIKSSVTSVGRGLWSDTKVIPGTQRPATAYYDGSVTGGTASIKLSYWDGSKFNVENVAADSFVSAGSATWVKLGFLNVGSNLGKPIVVWTTGGTTVKAAIRSAALGTNGSWTAGVIDTVTGAATRAASISVSPLDHVSIAYLTNSTAAGRLRFLYCDAPCTSLSSMTAMTNITDNVENTNQATNILGVDTAWCKFDSTTYYPSVIYHGNNAANIRYSVCANSNLASCRTSAGWTTSNVVASAAPVHMQMNVRSSVTQDKVNVLIKPAAGTALTTYSSASGCHSPGAFTVGANVVGAATAGTTWAKLMRDAAGLFHVVANNATTNVVYMNSNNSNIQTTTWNAAGTIETVTLPAVGAGAGGADIAQSYGMIYSSYGLAASPFNLNMGIVNDILLPSNHVESVFYTVLPDTTGHINMPLATGKKVRNVSVASISDGKPGVAYVDFSSGALTGGRLKYALKSGTTNNSNWLISILPNAVNPLFPSLAYDHNDLPWISYYDSNNFRYYLATNSSSDGSGTWTIYQAPLGAKTATATAPATDDTSVAMYYNNGIAQPVLVVINSTAAGGTGVRAIRLNPTTGQFGNLVTIDALAGSFATRLSTDFDINGNLVVAYYDLTTTTVKFNYSTNGGLTWKPVSAQISQPGIGREGLSIKINPANSRPSVSYYQMSANNVFLNQCTSSLSSCHNPANWTQTTVQDSNGVGVSGITASTHEQMLNTSLTFSASGDAYVTYATGISPSAISPSLALADNVTGFSPQLPTLLASSGTTASLAGASPLSQAQYGMSLGSVRNSLGQLFTVHVGPNNWLYSTSCIE